MKGSLVILLLEILSFQYSLYSRVKQIDGYGKSCQREREQTKASTRAICWQEIAKLCLVLHFCLYSEITVQKQCFSLIFQTIWSWASFPTLDGSETSLADSWLSSVHIEAFPGVSVLSPSACFKFAGNVWTRGFSWKLKQCCLQTQPLLSGWELAGTGKCGW